MIIKNMFFICFSFFYFTLQSVYSAPLTRTATIQSHGKVVGHITKTINTNTPITTTHIQIFSPRQKLTFERTVETHNLQILRIKTINHEYQKTAHVEKIGNDYFISHNKQHNDRKKLETSQLELISTDSLGKFLKTHWNEIIQKKEIQISTISIPQEQIMVLNIKYEGKKQQKGKTYIGMKITPDSFIMQTMMQTLGIESHIYLDPDSKLIMMSTGPTFNIPGHNPADQLPEISTQIIWNHAH
ncbi:MAG: hypothetical protein AB8C84_06010 [Oligoflexales bacterium]